MLPLISVIVPVYNAEKFLDKCIQSILNQTYTNLEVLLIDDGSTDNSISICRKYQMNDARVKVVQKINGGVSSARNIGLLNSKGEYISFVDSDDYLEINCLNILYGALIDNECTISCSSLIYETVEGKRINDFKSVSHDVIFTINNYDMYNRSVYNKLFHKSCLNTKKGPLLFDETLHYGEDALFTIVAFSNAKKIIRLSTGLYHYVIHENSAMQNFSHKSLTEIQAWSKIIKVVSPFSKATREAKAQYSLNSQRILINVYRYRSNETELQTSLLKDVRKYRNEVLKSSHIPVKNKVYFYIFSFNPKVYINVLKIGKKILKS
ncbi:glycosyltransferase family A protein [Exiguobacterium sp. s151]|uniref:glycosyltransferase family 2 protein n=1 Tax=Exiguobacterium sp. s151 TaxID=2751229 RepID=UPI001BE799B8|nr:glycosyltransferase family A protein [Exiguobacterium sp. s151]